MKVSRKVGRRKHSRGSSVSRRRFRNNKNKKSSYKKRYTKTHRGGCCSGSKAKKGGARSRKYGHKRGKRFHRGGVNEFNCEQFTNTFSRESGQPNQYTPVKTSYNNHNSYKNYEFELTFKKIDTFSITDGEGMFALKVYLSKKDDMSYFVEIVLERVSGSSPPPSFTFKGELDEILQDIVNPEKWDSIEEDIGSKKRKYNFNLGSNLQTFTKIADCLKSFKVKLNL